MTHTKYLFAGSAFLAILFLGVNLPASAQANEPQITEEIPENDNRPEVEQSDAPQAEANNSPEIIAQADDQDEDEKGWYVSLAPNLVFDYPVDIESDGPVEITTAPLFPGGPAIVANIPIDISLNTETGFGINGAVGYRFDDTRVELEVAYTNNDVESVTVNDLAEIPIDGDIESTQFMVNGYYDIPTKSRFSPYVGGGVGIATLTANDVEADLPGLGTLALDDTGASFIFQVKAGVGYEISDQATAFLGYRLYGLPGQDFEAFGADFDADTLLVHSIQLGARYEF